MRVDSSASCAASVCKHNQSARTIAELGLLRLLQVLAQVLLLLQAQALAHTEPVHSDLPASLPSRMLATECGNLAVLGGVFLSPCHVFCKSLEVFKEQHHKQLTASTLYVPQAKQPTQFACKCTPTWGHTIRG